MKSPIDQNTYETDNLVRCLVKIASKIEIYFV